MVRLYQPGRHKKYHPESNSGRYPTSNPGVYRVCNPDGEIMYIGWASNLSNRYQKHLRNGTKIQPGDSFNWVPADRRYSIDRIRKYERDLIARHNPPRNSSRGGEGRTPKWGKRNG